MPSWAKVVLITFGAIALIVIIAIVVGVIYVARNKDAWRAKAKEITAEGRAFGTTTDQRGCVDEMIVRYKKDPRWLTAISLWGFSNGCLETSRRTPGFCDKVPVGDLMKLVEWQAAECRHYSLENDSNCQKRLFMPVVTFCGEQRRKEKEQTNEM